VFIPRDIPTCRLERIIKRWGGWNIEIETRLPGTREEFVAMPQRHGTIMEVNRKRFFHRDCLLQAHTHSA